MVKLDGGGCHRCGHSVGRIVQGGVHVGLYCDACDAWQRWISKRDAGVSVRSMMSHRGVSPNMRSRVFERDGHRCVRCGVSATSAHLVVGHIISVHDGVELEMTDNALYGYWNLCCMCEECNAGLGAQSLPMPEALRLYHRTLITNTVKEQVG